MKTCARKGCIELAFPGGYFDGLCGRECQNMVEEYQRGRDEERADVVARLLGRAGCLTERHIATQERRDELLTMANELARGEHEVKR